MNHTASIPALPTAYDLLNTRIQRIIHARPRNRPARPAFPDCPAKTRATGPTCWKASTVPTSGCSTRSATAASSCAGVPPPDPVCRAAVEPRGLRSSLPFPSIRCSRLSRIASGDGMSRPTSRMSVWPQKAMVRSSSRAMISSARVTPACPARPARRDGTADHGPARTEGDGLEHVLPERMPLSSQTSMRSPTASTIAGSALMVEGAPSSWRPPWLLTTSASAPESAANRASSASRMPLSTSLPPSAA